MLIGASSKGDKLFDLINCVILGILGFMTLYPFLYMLAISFNEGIDTLRGGITIYPRAFTLENYKIVFSNSRLLTAYKITILRTILGTIAGVFVTALVAYGLSEPKLPGRKFIMIYLLIPMFFSGGLIPFFLQLRRLGLINTFWVYIFPSLFNIWNCIVMKTFFETTISKDLKDAARLDGANELQLLFKIVFPISKPLLAAISLFVAVGHWNDWFTGAFFIFDNNLVPVQTFLHRIMNQNIEFMLQNMPIELAQAVSSLSIKIAAVIIGTAPILVFYPFLQKHFAKGVMIGSLKE